MKTGLLKTMHTCCDFVIFSVAKLLRDRKEVLDFMRGASLNS